MQILEKKGYNFTILGSLLTLGVGVVALISLFILFGQEKIEIQTLQIIQITILTLAGIVIPGVVFALNFLADRGILKFKKDMFILAIITIVVGIVLVVFASVFIARTVDYYISEKFDHVGPTAIIIICLGLAIISQLTCIYGGAQNILYYKQNK
jgi:peptidoglycan/LPS O-acetylase OafA/YrhL